MKNVNTPKLIALAVIVCLSLSTFSCNEEKRETPTAGSLTMISSEDVFPVIDLQVNDFTRTYTDAKITHLSATTREAIVQLLNDSVKLIVTPRDFNNEEQRVVTQNEMEITKIPIAYDGVAVIVNDKNSITRISVNELKDILTGTVRNWSDKKASKMFGPIVVAMGEPNSGVYEYVKTRIAQSAEFAPVVFPCATSPEVISYVSQRSNAIGFVAVGWLSALPANVRVLEVGDPMYKSDSTKTDLEYFAPYQAHIYRNFYPLRRTISIMTHNAGRGVALGFSSFSAGAEGQKIIVKNGLVPATMPVRLVQLNQQ